MSTIQFTFNPSLDVTASPVDANASLNRYLQHPLSFLTPPGFQAVAGTTVGELKPAAFPLKAAATTAGKMAVEGSTLAVNIGATASVNVLAGDHAEDFRKSLQLPPEPEQLIVSFALQGTLSAGSTVAAGDFCFGVNDGSTLTVTSYCPAPKPDTFVDAVKRAISALTIPHDIADLHTLPPGCICQIDASSCLKFTASLTYSILNNPLATLAISQLPPIAINATAGATLEATAAHTAGHTITIARLANGRIHLSVSLTTTDDLETSLTASTGVAATIVGQDPLAFLLDKISPDSTAEMKKLKGDLPAAQAEQLTADIKAAVDAVVCKSLQASLKTAIEEKQSNNRIFLYEIDLDALDSASTVALQLALAGDFTRLTARKAPLQGITELESALTATDSKTHSLTLHLLGIFNYGSTGAFIEKTKIDYTKDTHEIVLSDETIQIVDSNLNAEKLRQILVKGVTLTLPAAANTQAAAASIKMVFFDRQASTSPSLLRQFANVLRATGAASADTATALAARHVNNYGTSLFLSLTIPPAQCRALFIDPAGQPYDWTVYLDHACAAQRIILDNDPENADRWKLFTLDLNFWTPLKSSASPPAILQRLEAHHIRPNALVDVVTVLWWSLAMERYANAIAANQSLLEAGRDVVKESTKGFNEPWLIVAAWNLLHNPALEAVFTCSTQQKTARAGGC